jgi:hypothetical protein
MTQPPYSLSSVLPVSKPPRPPGWVVPLVSGLVVLALAAGGVAAWALTRPASSSALPVTVTPSTTIRMVTGPAIASKPFDASGTITLIDDDKHWKVGDQCEGTGGFSDIRGGADVVVSGPSGESLALASLIGGFSKQVGSRVVCNFIFMVLSVPPDKGIYTLTIGHRPKRFTEAELREDISLSLGGS